MSDMWTSDRKLIVQLTLWTKLAPTYDRSMRLPSVNTGTCAIRLRQSPVNQ
jgi:hypothetical protein